MGITFISDTLVQHVKPDDNMIYFKLDSKESERRVCIYRKNGKYITKAIEEFLRIASKL